MKLVSSSFGDRDGVLANQGRQEPDRITDRLQPENWSIHHLGHPITQTFPPTAPLTLEYRRRLRIATCSERKEEKSQLERFTSVTENISQLTITQVVPISIHGSAVRLRLVTNEDRVSD